MGFLIWEGRLSYLREGDGARAVKRGNHLREGEHSLELGIEASNIVRQHLRSR